ncbi:hypothetical protein RF638_15370 [Kocuria sp. CPCC 205235]|uniref:hypothetical protein n=1 Tax=Kocuria sp. CPCC 205235 TaxID=3073549 RepID=UPI0034D461DB
MTSKQFVLSYATNTPMLGRELETRIQGASRHVAGLLGDSFSVTHIGDNRSGFVVWESEGTRVTWPAVVKNDNEGAAWLHIPAVAGTPDDAQDALSLARNVMSGRVDRVELGAPCAAIYWNNGQLRIVNDNLGMVRFFEYDMPDFGTVWCTRSGLAHVFAAVEPAMDDQAWAGMATLGWNATGRTHMGSGRQLPPRSKISVNSSGGVLTTQTSHDWMRSVLAGPEPSMAVAARDMSHSLSRALWWPQPAIADLSGGKDSRVTAAAAIRSGAVHRLRTMDTDSGEVMTAKQLVGLLDTAVQHSIAPVSQPASRGDDLLNRYKLLHQAWEGAYNARTAYRTSAVKTFKYAAAPKINGLGGEAMQGKSLLGGKWDERLRGADIEVGFERLEHMVRVGAGSSDEAGDKVVDEVRAFKTGAIEMKFTNAYAFMDYFYNRSKMPFWSLPLAQENYLLPYYSARMLERIIWSNKYPRKYGEMHKEILRSLVPAWSEIAFYKPSARTRSVSWMWENSDWAEARQVVEEGRSSSNHYSEKKISTYLARVDGGAGSVKEETAFSRILWERTFRDYVMRVASEAARVKREVIQAKHESYHR